MSDKTIDQAKRAHRIFYQAGKKLIDAGVDPEAVAAGLAGASTRLAVQNIGVDEARALMERNAELVDIVDEQNWYSHLN